MNDNQRQDRLSSAFSDVETMIGGHTMRPLSLATYDVMLRTGNPLVGKAGKDENAPVLEDGTPEFTRSIIGFVFIHCAPWPEVVRASFDEQEFREQALIFCGDFTPADFKVAFKRLEQQTSELEAAQAEATGVRGKKPRRATNPAS
jgi:hypothetical protein